LDAVKCRRAGQAGQGLLEYCLVLSVVVAVTVTVMSAISSSTATLISALVENIESVTDVSDSAE